MKWFKITLSFLLCSLLLVSSVHANSQPSLDLAYNPLPFNLPSLVERDQGFLVEQGYVVNYHGFLVGHAMTEAMVAGKLHIAPVMGGTSTIVSKAAGRDIKIIGCYSQAPSAFALATRPNTITLQDLKGTKIAVPLGTEAHVLLGKILLEQGLTLQDVQLVNLLVPDGITALQSGQVDATMVVEPVITKLVHGGKLEVLRNGEGLIKGITFSVVPSQLVNSELVQAFREAHSKSLAYIQEHPQEVLNLAINQLDLPLEVVEKVALKYTFEPEITEDILVELTETIDFLYNQQVIRQRIPLEDLF